MEALYHQYKRRVYGLVIRIVGHADCDEVAQEAFVRIYRGLEKFRGDSALGTWIYRLAVNAALSHVSKRARRPVSSMEVNPELPAPPAPASSAAWETSTGNASNPRPARADGTRPPSNPTQETSNRCVRSSRS